LLIYVTKGFALQLRTKSKHKATKVLLALLPLFATQGKQALEASKQRLPYACLWIVCTVVSTFGA
jgi:hypothetical protein